MTDHLETQLPEAPQPTPEISGTGSEKVERYKQTIYGEAIALLGKYLPEALPNEPTEITFSFHPRNWGRFKGKHYITTGNDAYSRMHIDNVVTGSKNDLKKAFIEEDKKFRRYFNQDLWIFIEQGYDISPDSFLTEQEEEAEEKPTMSWSDVIGSIESRQEYSEDTWQAIETTIHELIHQKQEELNPGLSPDLSTPELDSLDPQNASENTLWHEIAEASIEYGRTIPDEIKTSLGFAIMEGTAVAGSFYVISRLAEDLSEEGDIETAERIRKQRDREYLGSIGRIRRNEKMGNVDNPTVIGSNSPYDYNYTEGIKMVRAAYKQMGTADAIRMFTQVDLKACMGITRGSPEYQRTIDSPALLPKLPLSTPNSA